jgi:hypothetical protein
MAEWGIWDIIGLVGAVIPSLMVIAYLLPRRAIKNLYIDAKRGSVNQTYSKVVSIEISNHTNEPLYVISEGFSFTGLLKPSQHGKKNASTDVYEVKFEGRQAGLLSEIDTIIRANQTISTWVPVDPSQTDQDIDSALAKKSVGTLKLRVQSVSGRRNVLVRLDVKV